MESLQGDGEGFMKIALGLLALFMTASAMAEGWEVTQSAQSGVYVLCHEAGCPDRTVKVLDLPEPVAAQNGQPVPAAKPSVLPPSTSLHFRLASARIQSHERSQLKAFLLQHPDAKRFLVSGSTDRVGKKRFNQSLAKRRALAAAGLLRNHGIPRANISVDSRCCIGYPPSTNPGARRAVISINE